MKHLATLASLALLLSAGSSFADSRAYPADGTQWATVRRVEPVITNVPVPQRVCTEGTGQRVVQPEGNVGGAILGTVIGGAIGNRFGGGNGRDVATAAGAGLGAVMGYNAGQGPAYVQEFPTSSCRTVTTYQSRTSGYRVTYVYAGREYTTLMPQAPGKRIRVSIAVIPEGSEMLQDTYTAPAYVPPRPTYDSVPMSYSAPMYQQPTYQQQVAQPVAQYQPYAQLQSYQQVSQPAANVQLALYQNQTQNNGQHHHHNAQASSQVSTQVNVYAQSASQQQGSHGGHRFR